MANGTIVRAWQDGRRAYLAVQVAESGDAVEYVASLPLRQLDGLSPAQQRAALVAAVRSERDARARIDSALPGLSGAVTL